MGRSSPLEDRRAIWDSKPALRAIYDDYFRRLLKELAPGRTLEIGAGGAFLTEMAPDVVALDIRDAAWLDVVADAQALPFAASSFGNIAMVDVFHHLPRPRRFLAEAVRVLRPGGRMLLVEPAMTPVSLPFYRSFHPEPVRMNCDPLGEAPLSGDDPEDANQAIPTVLFVRRRDDLETEFPELAVRSVEYLSLWAYPLSGGFRPWCLIPGAWVRPLLGIEERLLGWLGRLAAFRLVVVVERRA